MSWFVPRLSMSFQSSEAGVQFSANGLVHGAPGSNLLLNGVTVWSQVSGCQKPASQFLTTQLVNFHSNSLL